MQKKKVHAMTRRLVSTTVLVLVLSLVLAPYAFATEETRKELENAKEQRRQSQDQLDSTNENIGALSEEKDSLQGELDNLNAKLTDVSNNLAKIETNIDQKQTEIEQTKKSLEEARQTEQQQYETMKARVQFIYEKQNFVMMEMLMESGSFGDFLNQEYYIEQLSAYDRQQLEAYQLTRSEIETKEAELEGEMKELASYQESAKAEQNKVAGLVTSTSGSIGQYADQISSAQEQADALESQIADQDSNISALEAKLAEEIRLSNLAKNSAWRDISEVSIAEGDRYLLANLIYCEAGAESYEGQLAVGSVVMNRVLSSVYPNTIVGVIYQGGQFAPVSDGHLALALAEDRANASCYKAADAAMSGTSNVGDCVYFRTPIPGLTGINIGGHVFY